MRDRLPHAAALAILLTAPASMAQTTLPGQTEMRPVQETAAARGSQRPSPTTLRSEDRAGYGRVVLPVMGRGRYDISRHDGKVVITYAQGSELMAPDHTPRNVTSIVASATAVEIGMIPGAEARIGREGASLVVDILDPLTPRERERERQQERQRERERARARAAAEARRHPQSATAPTPTPLHATNTQPAPAPVPSAAAMPTVAAAPAPATAVTVIPPAVPAPTAAPTPMLMATQPVQTVADVPTTSVSPPQPLNAADRAAAIAAILEPGATPIQPMLESVEPAILLRAPKQVGLAAFRLGGDMVLVLDAPITFQTAAISQDPVFGRTTAETTQDATVIRIPLPASASVRLAHAARGWIVTALPAPAPVMGITPRLIDAPGGALRMQLPASAPSRVVTVLDRQTGARLLVGTQGSTGEGMASQRALVQFTLLPTLQGVAIAPVSDDLTLRADPAGFSLTAGRHAGGTIVSGADRETRLAPHDTKLTRMFDFPDQPIYALARQLSARIVAASEAAAQARSEPRLRVAEAMVALGMGVEAQSVLDVAISSDPALKDSPRLFALRAIASIAGGRPQEATGLADPRLNGIAEIELWRSLLTAATGERPAEAARGLARTLPLLRAYPRPLRDRFLPAALEAMALGGQAIAAGKILDGLPEEPRLDLARGMVHEMLGDPTAALQTYDLVSSRPDRLQRYKALIRSVDLRLARGDIGPTEAANALDRDLYAWRSPKEELALRIRLADLRRQTGKWREAIAALRDGRLALPGERTRLDGEIAGVFAALLGSDAVSRMAPADFVSLYDRNADLLRQVPLTEAVGMALANRLVALNLPGRAIPVLASLITRAADPAKRAQLGARLASVRLSAADPVAALAALADTAPPAGVTLDPAVAESRQLLYARAEADRGNKDTALAMLVELGTADADELRAEICDAGKNWACEVAALSDLERKRILPTSSDLTDAQQEIVMRLAAAAALADDQATLDRLKASWGKAMAGGRSAAPFAVITAAPIREPSDLPRALEELRLAKNISASLGAPAAP